MSSALFADGLGNRDTGWFKSPMTYFNLSGYEVKMCEKATCRRRCGSVYPSINGNCFCDDLCRFYGDCCLDYEAVCLQQSLHYGVSGFVNETGLQHRLTELYAGTADMKCVEIPSSFNRSLFVLMETKCPEAISSEFQPYKKRCEEPSEINVTDLLLFIPVMVNSVYYRNRYCLMCHGLINQSQWTDGPSFMTPNIECFEQTDEAMKILEEGSYDDYLHFVLMNCKLGFVAKSDFIFSATHQSCRPSVCNTSLMNTLPNYHDLDEACTTYRSQVGTVAEHDRTKLDELFRNPHCAICNGINEVESLVCHNILTTEGNGEGVGDFPVFSIVLDMNGISPDLQDPNVLLETKLMCTAGSQYDVVEGKCKLQPCPNGVFFGDKCIAFADKSPQISPANLSLVYTIFIKWRLNNATADQFKALSDKVIWPKLNLYFRRRLEGGRPDFIIRYANVCENDRVSIVSLLQSPGETLTNPTAPYNQSSDDGQNCILLVIKMPFNVENDFLDWSKEGRFDFLWAMESIAGLTKDKATFQLAALTNFDAVETTYECKDGYVLNRREHLHFLQQNDDHFKDSNHFTIAVNQTALTYSSLTTALGIQVVGENEQSTLTSSSFALLCEAPILHCSAVQLSKQHAHVANETLVISLNNHILEVARQYFVTLSSDNFAVCEDSLNLEYFVLANINDQEKKIQGYLTLSGHTFSVMCLFWTFLTFCKFPALRTLPGKALMNLALSLALAQILFQVGPQTHHISKLC